ncbi:MAG: AAA family ATPase [Nanoarchaeota archaeon]|nr:AAA family ATPase [Nanoarchaeota archaeon]
MGKCITIGVISVKGGVGKTTVSSNISSALASEFGKKVLLVDANFSTPHCGMHVGLVTPQATIHDVLRGDVSPFQALYEHDSGLHVLPGSLLPKNISPLKLKSKLEPLKDYYDVIILDSSPSLNDEMLATIMSSDELLVVSSLDFPTLSATLHAVKIAKQRKVPIRGLVINRARYKDFELSAEDISNASGIPVLSVLPEDVKVLEALASSTPVTLYAPNRDISIAYKKLAGSLIGVEYQEQGMLSKFGSWFTGRK